MPSLERHGRKFALGVLLLSAAAPASAQFCAADPIVPPCCPTPCPVIDPARVLKLMSDVSGLGQEVAASGQIVQSMSQLGQAIGDTKTMASSITTQLSAFPATISSELTAIQSGLPANPVAALGSLKQSLFETSNSGQGPMTQSMARQASRIAAAQQEMAAALATSLMKSNSLPSSSELQKQIVAIASKSDQLHADFAGNSAARLVLYQDMGGLHQLAAAWLAQRATQAAVVHPHTAGGAVPSAIVTSGTPRQAAAAGQTVQSAVDQLVSLHDGRVSAQALLSAYPALQQTVASANLAGQFVGAAEGSLQKSLSTLGRGPGAALSEVEQALKSADASGWLDAGKDAQARQAARQVLVTLTAKGSLSLSSADSGQQLLQAMSGWLEASKQSQYWGQLAQGAQTSIANLDQRLGALSDQAGIDLTGVSAASAEAALLDKLRQDPAASRWQGLITAASQDPGASTVLQRVVAR